MITWQIAVPIFRNHIIVRQLCLAIGIPFGLVLLVLLIATGPAVELLYGAGMIIALFMLTGIFIWVLYGGKYDAIFTLNAEGVRCRTAPKMLKKNRWVNFLTVLLGLLSGKMAVAGAGVLAQSRQDVFIRWKNVQKVKYDAKHATIWLRAGIMESLAIFCEPERYEEVIAMVQGKVTNKLSKDG